MGFTLQTAICIIYVLIVSAQLERHTVDGFLYPYIRRSLKVQVLSIESIFELAASNDLDLQHEQPVLGHPSLLNAIKTFPQDLEETTNNITNIDARRLFHGRGGLYEGANHLTLDFYPPVFLLTSFEELGEDELDVYGHFLSDMWKCLLEKSNLTLNMSDQHASAANLDVHPFTWVYQCRAERGNSTTRLMAGAIPEPHVVTEYNGQNKFFVHLLKGQNHGLFLDMAAGRQWLQEKCRDEEVQSVLNLFAYTCAFSVAALNGGAETVINVDMSQGALKTGQRNHDLNDITGNNSKGIAKFLSHDLFKTWGKIKRLGPYDVVVADPPSFQKGSFVAAKDYTKVIRRLPSLLRPNGYALLCLNAPELDTEFLLAQVREGVSNNELHFVERLQNPAAFASKFSEKALKVLVFQYRPLNITVHDNDRYC